MNRHTFAAMFVLLILCGGCGSYRQRIGDDLRDTFKAKAGIGLGLSANVKATSFLDAGFGWGGYWYNAGLESRYTPLLHPHIDGCLFPLGIIPPLLPPDESPLAAWRMGNVRDTIRDDDGGREYPVVGQLFDAAAIRKWDAYGWEKRSPHVVFVAVPDDTYTDHPLGLEIGVGLVLVTARVGFDPVEFVDLLSTAFGFDLLRDNPPPRVAKTPRPPAREEPEFEPLPPVD